jgi:hypothetical protein
MKLTDLLKSHWSDKRGASKTGSVVYSRSQLQLNCTSLLQCNSSYLRAKLDLAEHHAKLADVAKRRDVFEGDFFQRRAV